MKRLLSYYCVQYFEFYVPNRFLAQWTFAGSPLEALNDRIPCTAQQRLVHLGGQRVIYQDVGTRGVGTKRPDTSGCQEIPIVFRLKEFS